MRSEGVEEGRREREIAVPVKDSKTRESESDSLQKVSSKTSLVVSNPRRPSFSSRKPSQPYRFASREVRSGEGKDPSFSCLSRHHHYVSSSSSDSTSHYALPDGRRERERKIVRYRASVCFVNRVWK